MMFTLEGNDTTPSFITSAIGKPHYVYWGSHGCKRVKGHVNPCICTCNDVYGGTHVYGDHSSTAVAKPM